MGQRMCVMCFGTEFEEGDGFRKCKHCGKFYKVEKELNPEDKCVICGAKRMSKKSKTCSYECAGKLAHQTGQWGLWH